MPSPSLAPVFLTQGDDNSLRVTNAINKNAEYLQNLLSTSRDYRYITEGIFVAEDYGSLT